MKPRFFRLLWVVLLLMVVEARPLPAGEGNERVFYLTGAVKQSGRHPMPEGPLSLAGALRITEVTTAGGASKFPNLRKVQVTRMVNGEKKTMLVDARVDHTHAREFIVEPADQIYVPERGFCGFSASALAEGRLIEEGLAD